MEEGPFDEPGDGFPLRADCLRQVDGIEGHSVIVKVRIAVPLGDGAAQDGLPQ